MLNIERYRKELETRTTELECEIQILMGNKPNGECFTVMKESCRICRKEGIEWLLAEYKGPILTEEEKTYLKAVMEPFKDRVNQLKKHIRSGYGTEYIGFIIDDRTLLIDLPDFESGTKYTGMELGRRYTPEELGL